jgi:hypothetical protein
MIGIETSNAKTTINTQTLFIDTSSNVKFVFPQRGNPGPGHIVHGGGLHPASSQVHH